MTTSKTASHRLWATLSLTFSVVLVAYLSQHFDDAENLLKHQGALGPILALVAYTVLSLTPISTDPLTVAAGALFGPFVGILISWLGNNLASFVEYLVGTSISAVTDFEHHKNKLPFRLGDLPADSPWFLIFGRFLPGYGGKIVSFTAGIYRVPLRRYLWTTFLTNLAGSLLLASVGFGLIKLLK